MHVSHVLSYLDTAMRKLRYTKLELELLVLRQLESLDALGERANLLKKQNDLLLKFNNKLIDELAEEKKELKPYPKAKTKSHQIT